MKLSSFINQDKTRAQITFYLTDNMTFKPIQK